MSKNGVEIMPYPGGNETIDRLHNGENLWIVNAHGGRKVLIVKPGGGEDEAWSQYLARWPDPKGKPKRK